ncbi:hypothetical protein HDU92_008527 [Lobulomyces angularis]|nr:hypothetical protein HDU92_008527 [Lobulomyces angularis]
MKVNTILAALVATTLATLYPKGSHDVVGRMSSGYAHKDLLPTRSLRAYSNNYSHKHSHYEHHDEYRPPSYRKKYYNKHHKSSYKKKKYHHHKSYLNSQDADDAVDSNSQDSDDENVHSKTTDHKTTDKSTEPETKKYSGSCVNYAKYSDLKRNCYAISCNLDPTGAAADQKCGKLSIVKQQFQAINAASADSTENAAVDSTGRQLAAPLENGISKINPYSTVTAIVLIITGFVLVFFGNRLFKPILFIAGFYIFAVLSFIVLSGIETRSGTLLFGNNRSLIFLIIALVSGILGGLLLTVLWKLGLSAIGGLLGYILAILILSVVNGGVIESGIGRTIFLVGFFVVGAILIHFIEKPILILGTALPGSYAMFFGIDVFANTGFNIAMQSFISTGVIYKVSPAVYGMMGGVVAVAIIGIVLQFSSSGTSSYRERSGYSKA